MDTEGIIALLELLPFAYIFSLPIYWLLHKLLRMFTMLDVSYWKLSIVAFIAALLPEYLAVLGWGGDASPPPASTSLLYVFLGTISFTFTFWLGARLLGSKLSAKATFIVLAYTFVLLLLTVFMTRTSG